MFMPGIITQKCFTSAAELRAAIVCVAALKSCWRRLASTMEKKKTVLICLTFKFSFHSPAWLGFFFFFFASFFALHSPRFLPPSMNVWLWEKALKEGLAGVNGGQLCQLLHPNEAALSFTKPQLITLQAISEQDCLSAPLPPPHPYTTPSSPTVNNIMTRRADERRSDWERGDCREEVRCWHHASLSRGRLALQTCSGVGGIAARFGAHNERGAPSQARWRTRVWRATAR